MREQPEQVEVPKRLVAYVQPGTKLGVALEDTGRDSFILTGAPVIDPEALAQMDIPGHETCVEVARVREADSGGAPTG